MSNDETAKGAARIRQALEKTVPGETPDQLALRITAAANGQPETWVEPHVELLRYRGKRGGFAQRFEVLWIARFVFSDGSAAAINQNCWHGHTEHFARSEAETWSQALGLPLRERHDDREAREGGHPPAFGTYPIQDMLTAPKDPADG